MPINVSAPPSVAYGADEGLPDMPLGMGVDDAIYHTGHSYPGGVHALAARMGVSVNTLTHKLNPNNATHHLHPRELVALLELSGNPAVLQAMAARLGYTVAAAVPDQSGGDPVEAFMALQCAFADLVRAVADPLALHGADGSAGAVTPNELRRASAMAADLHAAVGHVLAALRGRMRKAPGGGL